ncbi:MAG: DUF2975 domain-containing protein [Winogradskyella sp.]|uniref:DUF2975 domain-containing protein n=1 Tax=Winogradskyella sp. TaxID=1883156 RepID=UPI0017FA54CB|nr:DUF2975 domain-containing protein [Winogradskyella sp.]MBT8244595.1 DUF2975 domain-containing protein [Winogradskyella sp.]NNK22671.1 DUF2975 domain-containing protein [Winogradskyella sp.]
MKTIKILKIIISVYYYLLIMAFIMLMISFSIDLLITDTTKIPKILNLPSLFTEMKTNLKIVMFILAILMFYVLIKALHNIKKCLIDLSYGTIFSQDVVSSFKKSGMFFLIAGFVELLTQFVLAFFDNGNFRILDSSMILYFVIGLFFKFLSEVFLKGLNLQQENDLTI